MVQYIAQEFLDMIDALEKQTSKDVSHHSYDDCLELTLSDPDDETGDLDIILYLRWHEINGTIQECVDRIAKKMNTP